MSAAPPSTAVRARSQTVERASRILGCFTSEEPTQGLPALAAKLGLNQSTVYRYVASLQRTGLLARDERRGGYSLGLRLVELAGIALNQIEVRKQALDEMDKLRDEVGLLVNLAVLVDGDVLHLAHSAPRDVPRMYTALGRRAVAHCTALGKVMLAHQSWDEVRQSIARFGWRPYTEHSVRDFGKLRTELHEIRGRGYAVDREERRRDVVCVAAPIRDHSGSVVAALSLSGRKAKMAPERRQQLVPRLLEGANRISFRMGFHANAAYL